MWYHSRLLFVSSISILFSFILFYSNSCINYCIRFLDCVILLWSAFEHCMEFALYKLLLLLLLLTREVLSTQDKDCYQILNFYTIVLCQSLKWFSSMSYLSMFRCFSALSVFKSYLTSYVSLKHFAISLSRITEQKLKTLSSLVGKRKISTCYFF